MNVINSSVKFTLHAVLVFKYYTFNIHSEMVYRFYKQT